jgi:hypothetical protein
MWTLLSSGASMQIAANQASPKVSYLRRPI